MNIFFKIILTLLISQISFGQDTPKIIKTSFDELKIELQRRTDIAINLANSLSQFETIDKNKIKQLKICAVDFSNSIIHLNVIDTASIKNINKIDKRLSQKLANVFVIVEANLKAKEKNSILPLIYQLEGCENRVYLKIREYNSICKKYGQVQLSFRKFELEQDVKDE